MKKHYPFMATALLFALGMAALIHPDPAQLDADRAGKRAGLSWGIVPKVVSAPHPSANLLLMSNINQRSASALVDKTLKAHLQEASVNAFMANVQIYNNSVGSEFLNGGFAKRQRQVYPLEKMMPRWQARNGDFIGTNCRINSYLLLKENIIVRGGAIDDSLLGLDKEAIRTGHLFHAQEQARFLRLFSRVKTVNSKDIRLHAKKMKQHLAGVQFAKDVEMVSLVIHDRLDGESLFIGHVGILVPMDKGYLFVEKLSFEAPYQAIQFAKKEDCYRYLYESYQDFKDDTAAPPFVMANQELVLPITFEKV